ncbi:MAG: GIY-YIG nuclease family protein [Gemmatimonadetes bacterium]|nr:GIY-YIG nuclease family protein [Gemmatimonadota bacterium]
MRPSSALRAHVRSHAEDRPGVYRMYGEGGRLLYVGKSVRVRSRILSYFSAPRGEKAAELIREARRVAWEYVPNEFEALVREMKLIQRHRPQYNVQHKRKRAFAFVKVTREPAPRVIPVSRVSDDDALYFGPFPRVRRVADTVRELAYVLQLRDCPATSPIVFEDQTEIFAGSRGPRCLRGELGTCLAPCCGRTSAAAYGERVRLAVRYLEGRGRGVLDVLTRQMDEAAGRLDFEHAATLRDRAERLRALREELTGWKGQVESLTFLYRVPGSRGDDRVYLLRRGRIAATAEHPRTPEAHAAVARLVEEVYGRPDPGPGALSPEGAAEVMLVSRWFQRRPKEMGRAVGPRDWLEGGRGG